MNKNKEWLEKEMKVKGYTDFHDVLLATLDKNEKLTVYERNADLKARDVLE